jgi:hypothetical protein
MKKIFVILTFGAFSFAAIAQTQDPKSPGFDFGIIPTDSNASSMDGDQAQEAPVVKPYVRITLNVDSVTNLISYVGVVEQEETGSDSLYTRAKRWAVKRFTGGAKSLYEVDKRNQKLVINAWLPAYAYGNKYTKRDIGKYEFKVSVWIKEGRYKYQISNLVHEGVKSNEGNVVRNYFEYYYTSTTSIKSSDMILRYADRDINKLIEDFKKNMKDPTIVDEEEW